MHRVKKEGFFIMRVLKCCLFRLFCVCAGILWGVSAYPDTGGGFEPGGLTVPCDTYGVDTLPDGVVCNGNFGTPCPAGHWCTNGRDRGLCAAGKCAANNSNECVSIGGVQCKTCPSDTKYSNAERTGCSACTDTDEYLANNVCNKCEEAYNNSVYEPIKINGESGVRACGIRVRDDVIDSCADGIESAEWQADSRLDEKWRAYNIVINDDFIYVNYPNSDSLCGTCPAGTVNLSHGFGEESCVSCPGGYCSGTNNACELCPAGHYCPLKNDTREIYSCNTIQNNFKCPKGTFSAPGQVACTSCAMGYTTNGVGTVYDPDAEICQQIVVRLKFGETPVAFPSIFNQGKVNSRVIRSQ